ncbi:MAG: DUF167 domain-containing protein [bacterium]|nr:DUF167 domain-containing protein [bacterium]
MKIIVKAKPGVREERVKKVSQPTLKLNGVIKEEVYEVSVKEPPVDGRANRAIVHALAKHFGIAPSRIRLISGHTSKRKVFEIDS